MCIRDRLEARARYGWWPEFPRSPQEPHDRLVALLGLDRHCRSAATADGWATRSLAGDLAEAALSLETGDGPGTLAVRRAMLTIGLDLAECCDDSYGSLGHVVGEALETYAGTDWRSAGLSPEVFWPDFLEIATMLGNYGVLHCREVELFRRAGVAPDLDDVSDVAAGLHSEYTAARMNWHADEVRALYGHAAAAAGALDRFGSNQERVRRQRAELGS